MTDEQEMYMTEKHYHGYLALSRHALMLQADLGYSLFGLYVSLMMIARWHRGNPKIGYVIGTQTEIAKQLNIKQSTFSRKLDKLGAKKYLIVHTRYIFLKYFPLFLLELISKPS